MLILIKVGGSVIRKGVDNLVKEVPRLLGNGHKLVIVHGGGYFVSELMEKMGLKPRFVTSPSGVTSRYTDLETLRVYIMGMMFLNKDLVSRLQGVGVNAIGLSGVDGGLLRARRRETMVIIDERGRERIVDGILPVLRFNRNGHHRLGDVVYLLERPNLLVLESRIYGGLARPGLV
jgi:Acetylglutamate kinase